MCILHDNYTILMLKEKATTQQIRCVYSDIHTDYFPSHLHALTMNALARIISLQLLTCHIMDAFDLMSP